MVSNELILGIENNSLSKDNIVDELLSQFSETELENSLNYLNQKSSIIKQLDDLDENIFRLLSDELNLILPDELLTAADEVVFTAFPAVELPILKLSKLEVIVISLKHIKTCQNSRFQHVFTCLQNFTN